MSVHNPNNWHWIDKNCLPWAKEYLDNNLKGVSVTTSEYEIVVSEIKSVTGDCDVTQRKGKVKCIFDLNVSFNATLSKNKKDQKEELESEGDSEPVVYEIILPEFEHDQDDDEYNFEIKSGKLELKKVVRENLFPKALIVFKKFQSDLLATHEPKLQHNTN